MKNFILRHLKILLVLTSIVFTVLLGALFGVILVYQKGFPQIKNLEDIKPVVMSTVYDDRNLPFKEFAIEKRVIIKSSDIPLFLKQAIVAAEDNDFYTHWGINFKGVMRALSGLLVNQRKGGGSSITQQLARSLFLTPEVSVARKLKEMLLAIQIERKYSKEQILTFYCNQIFLGGSVYGVEAAARYYFGKAVREINLPEAALLAAIIPNPNGLYAVFRKPENCLRRRNFVLGRMLNMAMITRQQYQEALAVPLTGKSFDLNRDLTADYFAEDTRKYLESKYGDNLLYKGGLKVYTTLDKEIQQMAVESLQQGLRDVDKRRGWRSKNKLTNLIDSHQDPQTADLPSWEAAVIAPGQIVEGVVTAVSAKQAEVRIAAYRGEMKAGRAVWTRRTLPRLLKVGDIALFNILTVEESSRTLTLAIEQEPEVEGAILVVDNRNGAIKAMVGGYSFDKSEFNRAIQALRQTGSSFKPIVYTAALENGFSPATIIEDSPFSYVDEWTGILWEPRNHKGDFLGPVTLRRGLELSRNVVTAKILQAITPAKGVEYAQKFGIRADLKPYMSLALGAFEVTLSDMVAAFTVFANYGVRVSPYYIQSIRDLNNNIIEENVPERKQVIDRETAFIMNYILRGVVQSGTGWRARELSAPIGGKTGTTNDFTDAWFIGFSPSLTVGVWVGFDQKKSLGFEETGARAASPIFVSFMKKYLQKYPENDHFREPAGVVWREIDKYTGKLLTPDCLHALREAFLPGTEPLDFCSDEEHLKIQNYIQATEEESEED